LISRWQRVETYGLLIAIVIQLWLHSVSLLLALLWAVVVLALVAHWLTWMLPLGREQTSRRRERKPG
jgi:predicted tellurium resistance membrane protein TerC